MDLLTIALEDNRSVFLPQHPLNGVAEWELEENADELTLSLLYFTQSRAENLPVLVDEQTITAPGLIGRHEFSFELPRGPYSFTGSLITLKWAVELTIQGRNVFEQREFDLTHTGQPIVLPNPTREINLTAF